MHTQYFVIYKRGDRQTIEAVGEDFPELDAMSAFALVVKAIDAIYRGAFVISSQKEEVLWVFNLVGKQEADRLQRLLAPIDVIAEE